MNESNAITTLEIEIALMGLRARMNYQHPILPSGYSFRLSFGVAFFSVDISGGSE